MIIAAQAAQTFIADYSKFLEEVHRLSNGKAGLERLTMLAAAREVVVTTPSIAAAAVAELERRGCPLAPEVLAAIRSLRVKPWVYLRDTKDYSVFLDPSGSDAYAVLGLTDRLRDILGGSGVSLRTGLLEYAGRFVCDGIVTGPVWLGANYRKELAAQLAALKKAGKFHRHPERPPGAQPSARPRRPKKSSARRERNAKTADGNLYANAQAPRQGERFDTILRHKNLVVERIVSSAEVSGEDYVQTQDEWVVLLAGDALLRVAGEPVTLAPGDYVFLPAGVAHRVEHTSPGTLWLAVHLHPETPAGK